VDGGQATNPQNPTQPLCRLSNRPIPSASSLHPIAIHARRRPVVVDALRRLLALLVVNVLNIKRMYMSREESAMHRSAWWSVVDCLCVANRGESEGGRGCAGWDVPEEREADVDEEVGSAASDESYAYGRDWRMLSATLLRGFRGC